MRIAAAAALLFVFASCASAPIAPVAPEWDVVPAGIVEALCRRLQMDALATGSLAIVRVTQPLASRETVAAIAGSSASRNRTAANIGPITNRAIPVTVGPGSCEWVPIDVRQAADRSGEMVVELSAPLANPFEPGEAGLFARASLGSQHQSWYWIALAQRGGGWGVRRVYVLFR